MKIKRAYFVNNFKITPKQIEENDIFPKYIGRINGLPILEIDFKDTPQNRKLLVNSSLVSKLPRGFNSLASFLSKVAEEEGINPIEVGEISYNGSPILDTNFLSNLLWAAIRKLQDYRRENRLDKLYVGAEVVKKIVSYLSQSLEVGSSSPTLSLTEPSIYEFDPGQVAEDFSNEMAETIDLEFQRSEIPQLDFRPVRYSSLNKVASIIEKYSKIYPFLYNSLAKFANKYASIFLNPVDPTLGPKNLYYTKLGSIATVEDSYITDKGTVLKYKLDKKAIYNEVSKELFDLVKRAHIRYIPNLMPSLSKGKRNHCIVSSKGKVLACYGSEAEATKALFGKLGTYIPKNKKFYVVSYRHNPILITTNKNEALEAYTRVNNFANYLRYLTIHASLNRNLTIDELGRAIKLGTLFYLADIPYTITAIDEAAKSFAEFAERVEDVLSMYGVSGKATFTVQIPTNDTQVFSVKDSANFRENINENLDGFEEVGTAGTGAYISYVKSFEFEGSGEKNVDKVKREIEKLINEYGVRNRGKFPPHIFSFAINIEEPERVLITDEKEEEE